MEHSVETQHAYAKRKAVELARRILATLEGNELDGGDDWGRVCSLVSAGSDLQALSDRLHGEGEYAKQ